MPTGQFLDFSLFGKKKNSIMYTVCKNNKKNKYLKKFF